MNHTLNAPNVDLQCKLNLINFKKTNVFLDFLKSISLKIAEIDYRDMIDYVDKTLKPNVDD